MTRFAVSFVPLLVLGCASAPTSELAIDSAATPAPAFAVPAVAGPAAPVERGAWTDLAPASRTTEAGANEAGAPEAGFTLVPEELAVPYEPLPAAPADDAMHGNRFTIKGGYYSTQDTSALDDGYIINASWMRFFSKLFAIEFEAGYIDASGKNAGLNTDMWGIPLMLNGRLNVPVWVLDLYGGIGLGTIYYDISPDVGSSKDGWVAAGDAFLGASFNLGDSFALGLEGKYYVTDKVSTLDGGLDAYAVMLTFGFGR